MAKGISPGNPAPKSGQYKVIGPRGGETGREITLPKGKTVPPVGPAGSKVVLVDPTKNKSGKQ